MDNAVPHTPAWEAFTILSFLVAVGMLAAGIYYMPGDAWVRGFFTMGGLFTIGATANLTKTLRDKAEARAKRGETGGFAA